MGLLDTSHLHTFFGFTFQLLFLYVFSTHCGRFCDDESGWYGGGVCAGIGRADAGAELGGGGG